MANSVDPDQTQRVTVSDHGLNCLLRPVHPSTYGKRGICFLFRPLKVQFLASVLLVSFIILYYLGLFVTGPEATNIVNAVYDFRFYTSGANTDDILRMENVSKKNTYTIDTQEYRQSVYHRYYKKRKPSLDVDCDGIVNGDARSIKSAKRTLNDSSSRKGIDVNFYTNIANCDNFKQQRGYVEHPLTPEEREFPLAFGIVVYKDVEQAERLLRSIYRPHNYYCFHVDKKSENKTKLAFKRIAACFDNVFLVPNPVDVRWATITVLQAELLCMHYLWGAKKWKYYINLTGQEFPLKTNLEIVKILQAMNGANIAQAMKER